MTNKTKTEWAHLPNAAHIARVLAHVRANPEKWDAAWGAARDSVWGAARDAVWDAVWDAACDAACDAAWGAAWGAACDAVWYAARGAACDAARGAACDACAALVAWDEAGDLLSQPPKMLKFLSDEGVHAATLLLPAVLAMRGGVSNG
jgi:hypothetical protein